MTDTLDIKKIAANLVERRPRLGPSVDPFELAEWYATVTVQNIERQGFHVEKSIPIEGKVT